MPSHTLIVFQGLLHAGPNGLDESTLAGQGGTPTDRLKTCLAGLCECHLVSAEGEQGAIVYRANYEMIDATLKRLANDGHDDSETTVP